MKNAVAAILLSFVSAAAFGLSRYTSNYYKSDPNTYLNKVITLYIASAWLNSFEKMDGHIAFICNTAYQSRYGGSATVFVPEGEAKSFSRQYGEAKAKATVNGISNSIPSKPAKVKMIEHDGKYVFMLQ